MEHIAGWADVPTGFLMRPELQEWYRNGLRAITEYCAERLATPELGEQIARVLDSHPA